MRCNLVTLSALVAPLCSLVSTVPLTKRDHINDGVVLNYALTLEFLERAFYRNGLQNYTQEDFVEAGFEDPFYENLCRIAADEETHAEYISEALVAAGITATVELEYCFPSTDAKSFVTLSSVLEGVGVSAYVGASSSIQNKDYLTVAASILGIEARHTSYIRSQLGQVPFPESFETPLGFNSVFSLAGAFICGGTSPVALPFKAFPKLSPAPTMEPYIPGESSLVLTSAYLEARTMDPSITETTPIYAVFFSGLDKIAVHAMVSGDDYVIPMIPKEVSGQVYVLLSRNCKDFSDENTRCWCWWLLSI